jgi:hypothetical protein
MPRGHLNETYVKDVAVDWLVTHYKAKLATTLVVGEKETRVKSFGSGRADGLIVASLPDGSTYCVSLEAKSKRTLLDLEVIYDDPPWLLHGAICGLLAVVMTAVLGVRFPYLPINLLLWSGVFLVASIAFWTLTANWERYLSISVVQQVKRYPAHEKWIAISTDVYNALGAKQADLQRECVRNRIGLIRVSSSRKVCIIVEAARDRSVSNTDFLDCYHRAGSIRYKIQMAKIEAEQSAA